jgi:tRNA(adenine34) deaminase
MLSPFNDEYFMKQAFLEAQKAFDADEVPVGAVIVCKNQIIARGHNLTEQLTDVTAHAEIQAITAAAQYLGAKYLKECTLFVTLEPCCMCAGALYWSQIDRVVFAARDAKEVRAQQGQVCIIRRPSWKMALWRQNAANYSKIFLPENAKHKRSA